MEELKRQLVEKLGLATSDADKVGDVMKDNAAEVPPAVAGGADAIAAMLAKFGISADIVAKVVPFLMQHAAELPKWLGGAAAQGMLGKAMFSKSQRPAGGAIEINTAGFNSSAARSET